MIVNNKQTNKHKEKREREKEKNLTRNIIFQFEFN